MKATDQGNRLVLRACSVASEMAVQGSEDMVVDGAEAIICGRSLYIRRKALYGVILTGTASSDPVISSLGPASTNIRGHR